MSYDTIYCIEYSYLVLNTIYCLPDQISVYVRYKLILQQKKGKTCLSPSLIAEHFPGTVTDFTACSLPPPSAFTFDLLPKSDNVVLFYFIYLHVSKSHLHVSKSLIIYPPSSRPLFMYLTHVPSSFGAISSKKMLPAVFMLLSHLTFSFQNFQFTPIRN